MTGKGKRLWKVEVTCHLEDRMERCDVHLTAPAGKLPKAWEGVLNIFSQYRELPPFGKSGDRK